MTIAAVAFLGGCAGTAAEAPVRPDPEPDPEPTLLGVEAPPPEPRREPEPSLEDRWRAPFAVQSSGRTAAPPPRALPVARTASEGGGEEVRVADAEAGQARAPADRPSVSAEEGASTAPAPPTRAEPSAAEARAATDPAAGDGVRTHRVEWGETWLGLARRYGLRSAELAALNPNVDPERLRAGEVLRVPLARAADSRRTHTVVAGDSLWGISRRYGVSIDRLREVNRLDGDRVRIGQVLIIP